MVLQLRTENRFFNLKECSSEDGRFVEHCQLPLSSGALSDLNVKLTLDNSTKYSIDFVNPTLRRIQSPQILLGAIIVGGLNVQHRGVGDRRYQGSNIKFPIPLLKTSDGLQGCFHQPRGG